MIKITNKLIEILRGVNKTDNILTICNLQKKSYTNTLRIFKVLEKENLVTFRKTATAKIPIFTKRGKKLFTHLDKSYSLITDEGDK